MICLKLVQEAKVTGNPLPVTEEVLGFSLLPAFGYNTP